MALLSRRPLSYRWTELGALSTCAGAGSWPRAEEAPRTRQLHAVPVSGGSLGWGYQQSS